MTQGLGKGAEMVLTGAARTAGVMGWPVRHSLSPRLHGFWLRRHGIDGAYVPLAVPPEAVAEAIRALPKLGLRGCNVTVPHKQAALTAVDSVTPVARRIGAVNTVVIGDDGRLTGDNTDAFGFTANLRDGAADWSAAAGPAVVLGGGGAARAVVAALVDAGAPTVRLANRTRDRAAAIAADLGGAVTVIDWAERAEALAGAALLVNATSLGMTDKPALDIALDDLSPAALVNDIVYTPLETPLLANACGRGNPVVDGLGMLLHQARPGFQAWFGIAPEVTAELRDFVLAGLAGA